MPRHFAVLMGDENIGQYLVMAEDVGPLLAEQTRLRQVIYYEIVGLYSQRN